MKSWLKYYLWPLVASTLTATFISVMLQTQRVIGMLHEVGAEIPLGKRLSMTAYDLQHLGSVFIIFVSLAFVVAMTTALFIGKKLPKQSALLHTLAGAAALYVMLFSMKIMFFDTQLIAGARDALGMAGQILAGGLGGYAFHYLRRSSLST